MSINMRDDLFWKKFDEKLSKDNWQYIDYYILQSYLRSGQGIFLIDVSGADNLKYYNHPNIKYVKIPLREIVSKLSFIENQKDKTVICVCEGGPKSAVAAQILRFRGVEASFLSGGTDAVIQITAN